VGSQSPRGSYLVPSYKARRGPHASVSPYVQPTNGTPAIGSRTWSTMANKWIARTPRISAHSDHKHSKDLHARPDQLHPDPRAAQREGVEMNACVTVCLIVSKTGISERPRFLASSAARGLRSERQPHGERRSARAPSQGPPGGGVGGVRVGGPPPPRPPGGGWGGGRGHGPPLPLAYKAAPQSSILRTENELFSLWKSSPFYRPGGTFSLSSALCISGKAALRTNLSSASGARGEAWANVCKLLNELGRVVVRRLQENACVAHVRKCFSINSGLSEPARVLSSPLIQGSRWATCVCLYVQPTNVTLAIGSRTGATMANKWIARRPGFSAHSDNKHSKDGPARPGQVHPSGMAAIGFRTGAKFANKWIARRPRFSAHSDGKYSKDLLECPDQIHPDQRERRSARPSN